MSLLGFAIVAYCMVGVGLMVQGIHYLVTCHLMNYHQQVIEDQWAQLTRAQQRLMLGLLKGFGAGMFCTGLMITFSAVVPLRNGLFLAHWFLASISVMYTGLLVHVTRSALLPGAAPIHVTLTMFALCLSGALASIVSRVWLG